MRMHQKPVQMSAGDTAPRLELSVSGSEIDPADILTATAVVWRIEDLGEVYTGVGAVQDDGANPDDPGLHDWTLTHQWTAALTAGAYAATYKLGLTGGYIQRTTPAALLVRSSEVEIAEAGAGPAGALAFDVLQSAHGLAQWQGVKLDGTTWRAADINKPERATALVIDVLSADEVRLQSAGMVEVAGGHGFAPGSWYHGDGAPVAGRPDFGKIQHWFDAIDAERLALYLGPVESF